MAHRWVLSFVLFALAYTASAVVSRSAAESGVFEHGDEHRHHDESVGEAYYSDSTAKVFTLEFVPKLIGPERVGEPTAQLFGCHAGDRCVEFEVICGDAPHPHSKTQSHPTYNQYPEDPSIIKEEPVLVERIGEGIAKHARTVDDGQLYMIRHQRAVKVATLPLGKIQLNNGTEFCHPLFAGTDRRRIEFVNLPVYAIITKTASPVDPSLYVDSLQQYDPWMRMGQENRAKAASLYHRHRPESPRFSEEKRDADDMMCGISLVAKGPVTYQVGDGANATNHTGTIEITIVWYNGAFVLPSAFEDIVFSGMHNAEATPSGGAMTSLAAHLKHAAEGASGVFNLLDTVCQYDDVPVSYPGVIRVNLDTVGRMAA